MNISTFRPSWTPKRAPITKISTNRINERIIHKQEELQSDTSRVQERTFLNVKEGHVIVVEHSVFDQKQRTVTCFETKINVQRQAKEMCVFYKLNYE